MKGDYLKVKNENSGKIIKGWVKNTKKLQFFAKYFKYNVVNLIMETIKMIDKVNNITSGNSQSKRSIDENKVNKTAGDNKVTVNKNNSSDTDNVKISQELGVANLSKKLLLT